MDFKEFEKNLKVNTPAVIYIQGLLLKLINQNSINLHNILDIGTGTGFIIAPLILNADNITGIDLNCEIISLCKEYYRNHKIQFVCGDFLSHKFAGKFTLISMFNVLEHVENDYEYFKRSKDLLTQDGHLVISVPAHSQRYGPADISVGHYRRYDKKVLENLLTQHGYSIKLFYSLSPPGFNLIQNMFGRRYLSKVSQELTLQSSFAHKPNWYYTFFPILKLGLPIYRLYNFITRNWSFNDAFFVVAQKT